MADTFDYLPYFAQGTVIKGFGRGSSELGIRTANFPEAVIRELPDAFECGVYYGWACLNTLSPAVYKMVMCVGWNPHYKNTVKTMETHLIHKFESGFYGENLRIIILGYIRPMCAFDSLDSLIQAMNSDIKCAESHLDQKCCQAWRRNPLLISAHKTFMVGRCLATRKATPAIRLPALAANGHHLHNVVNDVGNSSETESVVNGVGNSSESVVNGVGNSSESVVNGVGNSSEIVVNGVGNSSESIVNGDS